MKQRHCSDVGGDQQRDLLTPVAAIDAKVGESDCPLPRGILATGPPRARLAGEPDGSLNGCRHPVPRPPRACLVGESDCQLRAAVATPSPRLKALAWILVHPRDKLAGVHRRAVSARSCQSCSPMSKLMGVYDIRCSIPVTPRSSVQGDVVDRFVDRRAAVHRRRSIASDAFFTHSQLLEPVASCSTGHALALADMIHSTSAHCYCDSRKSHPPVT